MGFNRIVRLHIGSGVTGNMGFVHVGGGVGFGVGGVEVFGLVDRVMVGRWVYGGWEVVRNRVIGIDRGDVEARIVGVGWVVGVGRVGVGRR